MKAAGETIRTIFQRLQALILIRSRDEADGYPRASGDPKHHVHRRPMPKSIQLAARFELHLT